MIWQNLKMPDQTAPLLMIVMLTPVLLSFVFRRIYHISGETSLWQKSGGSITSDAERMTLDGCIMNGFETITRIGGYIILFSILISYVKMIPAGPPFLTAVLLPSLELTFGAAMICSQALPKGTELILTLALTSFGGWCAAAQTRAMLQDTDIPFLPYIIEKLAAALVTSLFAYCYLMIR